MPKCVVTVAIGKRAKEVEVEFAKGLDIGGFQTVGDWCADKALELEPNAEKVIHVGGLTATDAEIAADTPKVRKPRAKPGDAVEPEAELEPELEA